MSRHAHPDPTPYAPARGYLVPILSLALSLPPLLCTLSLFTLATYHAATGGSFNAGGSAVLLPPLVFGLALCYIVLGPMAAFVLCLTQRTRAEQTYGSALLLGYRMKRLNTIALCCAGLAVAVLVLLLAAGMVLRGGT